MYFRKVSLSLFLVSVLLLQTSVPGNNSVFADAETVITPDSYEGKEIQKAIDILKKAGGDPNDEGSPIWLANNIKKYLDDKKIIKKDLEKGTMGKNFSKDGPVYLDPQNFLPESMSDGKGFDPNKPDQFQSLIMLMETIAHEKFHSENHGWHHRLVWNLSEELGGENPMEAQTWTHIINLLDQFAVKYANNHCKKIPKEQPEMWVQCIDEILKIISTKKIAISDYHENGYGDEIPDEMILGLDEYIKKLKELREEWKALSKLMEENSSNEEFGQIIKLDQEKNSGQYSIVLGDFNNFEENMNAILFELDLEIDLQKDTQLNQLNTVLDSFIQEFDETTVFLIQTTPELEIVPESFNMVVDNQSIEFGHDIYSDDVVTLSISQLLRIYQSSDPHNTLQSMINSDEIKIDNTSDEFEIHDSPKTTVVKLLGSNPTLSLDLQLNEIKRGIPIIITVTNTDGTTSTNAIVPHETIFIHDVNFDNKLSGYYKVEVTYDNEVLQIIDVHIEIPKVPVWIKNNVKWWADGQIDDQSFVSGLEFLIKEGIIKVDKVSPSSDVSDDKIPTWIKNNVKWWADGQISEDDLADALDDLNDLITTNSCFPITTSIQEVLDCILQLNADLDAANARIAELEAELPPTPEEIAQEKALAKANKEQDKADASGKEKDQQKACKTINKEIANLNKKEFAVPEVLEQLLVENCS